MHPQAGAKRLLRIMMGAGLLVAGCAAERQPRGHLEETLNGADPLLEGEPGWGIALDPAGHVSFADPVAGTLWRVDARGRAAALLDGVHAHELYCDADGALSGDDLVWDPVWRGWRRGLWRLDPVGSLKEILAPTLEVPPGMGLLSDRQGNRYAFGRLVGRGALVLFRRAPNGIVTRLAGGGPAQADGRGAAAGFERVRAVQWGPDGALYASDGAAVRRITLDGSVSTLGGNPVGGLREPWPRLLGLTIEAPGKVLVADYARGSLLEIAPGGAVTERLAASSLWSPTGVVAGRGGIYVLETRPAGATVQLLGLIGPRLRVRRLAPRQGPLTLARAGIGPLVELNDPALLAALVLAPLAILVPLAILFALGALLVLAGRSGRPLFAAPVGQQSHSGRWLRTNGFAIASWFVLVIVLLALLREIFGSAFEALHLEALVVLFLVVALLLQLGPSLVNRIRKLGPVEFSERTSGLLAMLDEIEDLTIPAEGLKFGPIAPPQEDPPAKQFAYIQADRYLTLLEQSGEEVGSGRQRDRYWRLLLQVGRIALGRLDYHRSLHWLERLRKLSEGRYEPSALFFDLGQAYQGCARLEQKDDARRELLGKASDCYHELVRENPDDWSAWFWLAYVEDDLKNYRGAMRYNRHALLIRSQLSFAKYNLAAAALKAGLQARSLRALDSIRPTDEGFALIRETIAQDPDFLALQAEPHFVQLCQNWKTWNVP